MIVDARNMPEGEEVEADVVIVGAGAAGITLAREFAGEAFRVGLLESGGLEFEQETQSLCAGKVIGLPYFPLDEARIRYFGGTTNVWSGLCRPLDPIDFEAREWIPHSGWPFDRSRLDPFYRRAQEVLQLGPCRYGAKSWLTPGGPSPFPLAGGRVASRVFQLSPPTRFGRRYREELRRARNLTVYLHANAVEIETDEWAGRVTGLLGATLEGNRFRLSARLFLLALGGIETPRLLLSSDRVEPAGLVNRHGLVGRYFMEHPHIESGVILPSVRGLDTGFYRVRTVGNVRVLGTLVLPGKVLRSERLPGFSATLRFTKGERYEEAWGSEGVSALRMLYRSFRERRVPPSLWGDLAKVIEDIDDVAIALYGETFRPDLPLFRLFNRIEQVPNPDSRLTLGRQRDPLGMRRVRLDWRLGPLDRWGLVRAHEILGREFGRSGLGRLKVELRPDDESWPHGLMGGGHHMGTTRMHRDPRKGVVDADGRVHGIANLYIAGPSVFPTGGTANPMLTIIALGLRLADRVKERMR